MPTEEDARRLLANAATIEVDESTPMTLTGLPEPHARRWPVLAAAAAVVLAIGGGYLVAEQLRGDEQVEPAIKPDPVGARLPGLIGYTKDEAAQVLSDRDVQIVIDKEYSCDLPAGYVVGMDPGPGAIVAAGGTVRVRVVAGILPSARCRPPLQGVWDLVRVARTLDDDPASLRGVQLRPGVLSAVVQMISRSSPGGASHLEVRRSFDPCSGGVTDSAWDLAVWVDAPVVVDFCPDLFLLVQLNATGGLAEVAVADPPAETLTEEQLAATLNRLSSARRFVAWARGDGRAPPFADRVRVMFFGGGAFGSTGWVDDPENRGYYSGCSGLGFPDCGVDPVAMIYRYDGRVAISAGRSSCADGGVVPKRFADAEQDAVSLSEPAPCSALVELWIDSDGVIYGVNQAGAPS